MEAEARAKHYQQMMQQQQQQQNGLPPIPGQPGMPQIMVNEPGKEPRALMPDEIINLIQTQQEQLQQMQQILQNTPQIMSNAPGETPRPLTTEEILRLVQGQQQEIEMLNRKVYDLEYKLHTAELMQSTIIRDTSSTSNIIHYELDA
jgi:hypothetical protein